MRRLKKSLLSWATNQSQLSTEEGYISWPLLLKWLGSVEKAIFLSRDIALLWWKLQKEGISELDEWPGHRLCTVHYICKFRGKWIPNSVKSTLQSQSECWTGRDTLKKKSLIYLNWFSFTSHFTALNNEKVYPDILQSSRLFLKLIFNFCSY